MNLDHHHAPLPFYCMQWLPILLALLLLTSCSSTPPSITEEQSKVDYGVLLTMPVEPILFDESVKPVLENRCVVCHGCTDAPCQLKLSSYEGITRGANKDRVYNGARLSGVPPSRLFIDARTRPPKWPPATHPTGARTGPPQTSELAQPE